jgi:hypothetical protein
MPHSPFRRAVARAAGLAATLACLVPAAARAQAVERGIYASVLDEKGAPVASVSPADVVVREDGIAREVLRITPATEPLEIAVLVDTSAGLAPDTMQVRDALTEFVTRMAAANRLSIVGFGERPTILADTTSDLEALRKGVSLVFPRSGSGAYMLDAVLEVSRGFQKRETARPVVVVVLAGGVEFSTFTYDRVLDALKASGAAMFVFDLSRQGVSDMVSDELRNRNVVLSRGTAESGGERWNLVSNLGLSKAMNALADELLHQVRVVYARPQTMIPPEHVTITAARPGLKVRGTPIKPSKGT